MNRNLLHNTLNTFSWSRECTFLLGFILCFGLSTGVFFETMMSSEIKEGMQSYLVEVFNAIKSDPFDLYSIVYCLFINLFSLLIIGVSGCSRFSCPAAVIIFFLKGLSLGYCCALILETLSLSGILVILIALIPQNTVLLPSLLLGAGTAIAESPYKKNKGRCRKRNPFSAPYLFAFLLLCIAVIISCFIQTALFPLAAALL